VLFVATTAGALATTLACAFLAWVALQRTGAGSRARFMAVLGLLTCGIFVAVIIATALPPWILKNACN
jgi:hypothetical protein